MANIYKLLAFGDISLAGFEEAEPMGSGEAPSSYFRMPSGGAIDNFGAQQTFPGGVSRSKSVVQAKSTNVLLQTKINQITQLRGVRDKLYRLTVNGDKQFVYARLANVSTPRETENSRDRVNITQSLALTFECESDQWQGDLQGEWFINDGNLLNDGLELNSGLLFLAAGSPETIEITIPDTATGSAILARAIEMIVDAPVGASFASVKIENTKGEILLFTGTVAADKSVIINTGNQTVRNNLVDAYDDLAITPGENPYSWFSLDVGLNTITVTHDGIYSISFIFREIHL